MSTSKHFNTIAILFIFIALVVSVALALTWQTVDRGSVMNVSANDLASITEYINLDESSGELDILAGGTYYFTGTLSEGRIVVDVDNTESVILVLSGAAISCSSDSAIYVANSGNCAIYLEDGTDNVISSGIKCEINKNAVNDDAEGGALLLKDNATICGGGNLTVYGYINNGIHCSNDLYIESGNISVTAINNGIKGKDSLTIDGGCISIIAGNAGLKSGQSGDSDSGSITVNDGYIDIVQSYEGMEANQITINDGEIYIVASDDGMNACGGSNSIGGGLMGMGTAGNMQNDKGGMGTVPGDFGKTNPASDDHADADTVHDDQGDTDIAPDDQGNTDTKPDNQESSGNMGKKSGAPTDRHKDDTMTAESPDKAGNKPGSESGSGRGQNLKMQDGKGGGREIPTDESLDAERNIILPDELAEENSAESSDTIMPTLTINGGYVYILAGGDGLDSNGDLIINDGTVIVDGPSNDGNGALDSGSENGGSLLVNGGTLIAVGGSGMAEEPESGSAQNYINCRNEFDAGDRIAISDADGNVIFEYNAAKSGDSVIFSSPKLKSGESYTVSIADKSYQFTID